MIHEGVKKTETETQREREMSVERSNGSKNGKATYIDVSICKPGLKDPQDDVLVQGGIQSEVLHLGLIHGSGCSPGGRVFGFNRNEGGVQENTGFNFP